MAKGTGQGDTLQGTLMDAAQALTRALGTPEAANPQIASAIGKLQAVTLQLARGGGAPPPGAQPAPGAPGAGMGPPGGGAANPAMPAMTGGQQMPPSPGSGATMGIPQPTPDDLRRMIAQQTG